MTIDKIKYTRDYCKAHKIRYQIRFRHSNQLYIYSPITRHYMYVCYELLNLTPEQIRQAIENHVANYLK